jgi:hypothetical protein
MVFFAIPSLLFLSLYMLAGSFFYVYSISVSLVVADFMLGNPGFSAKRF